MDSSSLSPAASAEDPETPPPPPVNRSFSCDSFSRLEVGTGIDITTSSFDVEFERFILTPEADDDDVAFIGILFPMYLSSVDLDLSAGFGDDGGETNSEDGLVLMLLPLLFTCVCEQADFVLRWDEMLR